MYIAILLALLPLIGYLLVLGAIRMLGQTIVTTGGRDIAALGVAISGFVAVGPAELFFPNPAAFVFGPWVWVPLIAFYGLVVSLIALTSKPKLVVYGRRPDELYAPLIAAAKQIDPDTQTLDALRVYLPTPGIHLRLDGYRDIDYAQVIAFEANVPLQLWNELLANLRVEVDQIPGPVVRHGHIMLLVAAALIALILWVGIEHQELVVQDFRDWLWR